MKKKILCLLALVGMIGVGTSTIAYKQVSSTNYVVLAEGEEEQIEEEVVEETADTKGELTTIWDTKIMPLFAGMSLANIASFVGTLLAIVIKAKLDNKARLEETKRIKTQKAFLDNVSALVVKIQNHEQVNNEEINHLTSLSNHIVEDGKKISKGIQQIDKITELVVLLAEMIVTQAKSDKKAVTSGVAKAVADIEAKMTSLR